MAQKADVTSFLDEGMAFDIAVRKGVRGYTGYYGHKGRLHSTKNIHSRASAAKEDALSALVWTQAIQSAT